MLRYFCDCGTELFFENTHCSVCGVLLGFDPERLSLLTLSLGNQESWYTAVSGHRYRLCELRGQLGCNWLIGEDDDSGQCLSCRLTRTIPSLAVPHNLLRWQRLEQTKRRALYTVLRLRLPLGGIQNEAYQGTARQTNLPPMMFDFLEDRRSNPNVEKEFVYSGHANGVITLNAAEADDSFRAANREMMNELYRTLLGHFRHEFGHYYALLLNDGALREARQLFGDEREDYRMALGRYYAEGAKEGWGETHISAYASAHALEDWAETWAHYLHILDALETAAAYGVIEPGGGDDFDQALSRWAQLSITLNALNRSMGVDDAYPFVLTPVVRQKLALIDRLARAWRMNGHSAAGQ